jgi:hypothetical protein
LRISPRVPPEAARSAELTLSLSISCASVGLSLVDTHQRKSELLYARASPLMVSAMASEVEMDCQVVVQQIQVDNQLPSAAYATAVFGAPASAGGPAATAGGGAAGSAWLQANISRRREEKRVRHLQLSMGETHLQVEESFLHTLHAFGARVGATAAATMGDSMGAAHPHHPSATGPAAGVASTPTAPLSTLSAGGASPTARLDVLMLEASLELPPVQAERKRPWYLDSLSLEEARLVLSYRRLSARLAAEAAQRSGLRLPITLPNFEALPLKLRGFARRHLFLERSRLERQLATHFSGEITRQLHKIVLHVASGTLHAHGEHAYAPGATAPARNVVQGVVQGGVGLGKGLYHGLTGIVSAPVRGASAGGVSGFARGLGRGLVGAAIKPTAGMLELASKTAQGIKNTGRVLEVSELGLGGSLAQRAARVRVPRMLHGPAGAIRPYDQLAGAGWSALVRADRGRYVSEGLACCVTGGTGGACDRLLLLTSERLMLIELPEDAMGGGAARGSKSGLRPEWQVPLRDLTELRFDSRARAEGQIPGGAHALVLRSPALVDAAAAISGAQAEPGAIRVQLADAHACHELAEAMAELMVGGMAGDAGPTAGPPARGAR